VSDGSAPLPPLTGVRVLDFTRFVAGPYATMLLADAGAEVVKVEPLGGDETRFLDPMIDTPSGKASGYFHRFNRSKRSVCVDLASPAGREIVRRLVPAFDVVVENFRPGVAEALGLGYRALSELSPSVVYCSISGYGHTPGAHRDDPAFAILAEVTAGVVGRTERPEDPPVRLSAPLGDLFPASHAVSGIAMALFRRERTGRGAHVDMAMFDALVSLNENAIAMSATTGKEMLPSGRLSYTAPFGIFRASDGYLCIAVLGEKMWHRFCEALERPDLAADPGLASGTLRSTAMDGELGAVIAGWLATRTRQEAIDRLVACGVPSGIVATPFDVIASPQTETRGLLWDVPSYTGATTRMVASPIRIEPDGFAAVGSVPAPGQDTVDVLTALGGYSPAEVETLLADGVVEAWRS
jgi:crotonobetainyl-CoA:carnitine CoA-transferase CaiB-like acyl-CoA transferase